MTGVLVRGDWDTDTSEERHENSEKEAMYKARRGTYLRRRQPCQHLDLEHLALRTVRK